jgi:integrase/recombinase XerD
MKTKYHFCSSIGPIITRYMKLKLALGRQYEREYRIFTHLDKFLNINRFDLTSESFTIWCYTRQTLTPGVLRDWMRITRDFCVYRQRTEPLCFIPDPLQFPAKHQSIKPHIFTEAEIVRLVDISNHLKLGINSSPLRKENSQLALILLYTTGLRSGELRRLTINDYNSIQHTLLIRESKFKKSRLIPLSVDGSNAIEALLKTRRQRRLPVSADLPLLWHRYGEQKYYTSAGFWQIVHSLFEIADIRTTSGKLPRVHDLRHTFAVHALLRWYRDGVNVQAKLPILSTYMGHASVLNTQYYLRFIDDVASLASKRFEKHYSTIMTDINNRGDL